jgi:hypothetical protein
MDYIGSALTSMHKRKEEKSFFFFLSNLFFALDDLHIARMQKKEFDELHPRTSSNEEEEHLISWLVFLLLFLLFSMV